MKQKYNYSKAVAPVTTYQNHIMGYKYAYKPRHGYAAVIKQHATSLRDAK